MKPGHKRREENNTKLHYSQIYSKPVIKQILKAVRGGENAMYRRIKIMTNILLETMQARKQ